MNDLITPKWFTDCSRALNEARSENYKNVMHVDVLCHRLAQYTSGRIKIVHLMLEVANGKRDLPTRDELREWAFELSAVDISDDQ